VRPDGRPIPPPPLITDHTVGPRGAIGVDGHEVGLGRRHAGAYATAFRTGEHVTVFMRSTRRGVPGQAVCPAVAVGLPRREAGRGRRIAEQILAAFPTCPIPEIKRLGNTLKQWREAFLAYFDTGRARNGGTEAINGLIELHRRIARGFRNRDNYRLRMLLIDGGLTSPHLK
jgi:hypothetical protein